MTTPPRLLTGNAVALTNDGSVPMSGDLVMRGNRVTRLGAPVDPDDAARLADVGGGGGGGWSYVLDSTGTGTQDPSANVYTSFADLMAALDALPQGVAPTVMFLGNVTLPAAGMPVTGWNFRLGSWISPLLATGSTTVTIPDGVLIDSLTSISNGLAVACSPTTVDGVFNWNYLNNLAPGAVWVLAIGLGAALANYGTKALILGPGTGQFIVMATQAPSFGAIPPSTAEFVKADAPDIVIAAQSFSGFYGSLPDGWLTGSAFRVEQRAIDTRPAEIPGATGPIVVSAQSVLDPRGQRATRRALIYTNAPIDPTETDTFDDWTKLYAVYDVLLGPVDILFKEDVGVGPLHVPSGTWTMKPGTRWESVPSVGEDCQVYLDDGCEIVDLTYVGVNVAVIGNSTSPSLLFTASPAGNRIFILEGLGATLANAGASPMIDWSEDSTTFTLLIGISKTASISAAGGGAPVINVTPSGAHTSLLVLYNLGGTVEAESLSGSDGPGTAIIASLLGADAHHAFKQSGWTAATPLGTVIQPNGRPRFNVQTAPLTAVGPYVMGDVTGIFSDTNGENGSEFVRVDPSANIVGVQLPDPRYVPGQTVLVKEVGGAPAFTTDLTTPSGNIEGAAGPYSIPATPYFAVRLTSDGVDWWIS